jgi:hypothetical protein
MEEVRQRDKKTGLKRISLFHDLEQIVVLISPYAKFRPEGESRTGLLN